MAVKLPTDDEALLLVVEGSIARLNKFKQQSANEMRKYVECFNSGIRIGTAERKFQAALEKLFAAMNSVRLKGNKGALGGDLAKQKAVAKSAEEEIITISKSLEAASRIIGEWTGEKIRQFEYFIEEQASLATEIRRNYQSFSMYKMSVEYPKDYLIKSRASLGNFLKMLKEGAYYASMFNLKKHGKDEKLLESIKKLYEKEKAQGGAFGKWVKFAERKIA